MPKYAVLWDIQGEVSTPVGIALERADHVCVNAPWNRYGVAARFDAPYRVLQQDGDVIYRPGDSAYFDQVLVDISSMFAIGERSEVDISDDRTLVDLFTRKVYEPANALRTGTYCVHLMPTQTRLQESLGWLVRERLFGHYSPHHPYVAVPEPDLAEEDDGVVAVHFGPSVAA